MTRAFKAAVTCFACAFWLLWIAGAIYRKSEEMRIERETAEQVRAYNQSIRDMQGVAAKLRQTQRETR